MSDEKIDWKKLRDSDEMSFAEQVRAAGAEELRVAADALLQESSRLFAEDDGRGAEALSRRLVAVRERLSKIGTEQDRRALALAYMRMGNICLNQDDLAGAKRYFLKQRNVLESLMRSDLPTIPADLSICYSFLAEVCEVMGETAEAEKYASWS